jgi:hypothetical protein
MYHNFDVGDLKENMIFCSGRRAAERKDAELGQGVSRIRKWGITRNQVVTQERQYFSATTHSPS